MALLPACLPLTSALTLGTSGILTLNQGILALGANTLTLNNTASTVIQGNAPSASNMIEADGAGFFTESIPTGASVAFYPVGTYNVTPYYSPVTMTFTANATAGTIGARVLNVVDPNNGSPTDYLTRYFAFTSATVTTYTYNITVGYVPSDVHGTLANIRYSYYNNSTWVAFASSAASNVLTCTETLTSSYCPAGCYCRLLLHWSHCYYCTHLFPVCPKRRLVYSCYLGIIS